MNTQDELGAAGGAVGIIPEAKSACPEFEKICSEFVEEMKTKLDQMQSSIPTEQWSEATKNVAAVMNARLKESLDRLMKEVHDFFQMPDVGQSGVFTKEQRKEIITFGNRVAESKKEVISLEEDIEYLWNDYEIYEKDETHTHAEINKKWREAGEKEQDYRKLIEQAKKSATDHEIKLKNYLHILMKPFGEEMLQQLEKMKNAQRMKFKEFMNRKDVWFKEAWEKQLVTPSGSEIVDWASRTETARNQRNRGNEEWKRRSSSE